MLKIVQYEVYFLDDRRWYFQARYPGAERDEAIADAYRTERRTGYPTKVIKDTYHRDLNYSEETTAYISPNAKRLVSATDANSGRSQHSDRKTARSNSLASAPFGQDKAHRISPISDGTFFVRLVLALGGSMVLAAALTALLGTTLNALNKIGYRISSESGSQISVYWYIAMFILSAVALNKKYVPWRQVFSKRSEKTTLSEKSLDAPPKVRMSLKDKHPDASKEAKKALEKFEMKTKRGDLDVAITEDTEIELDTNMEPVKPFTSEVSPAKESPKENKIDAPSPPSVDGDITAASDLAPGAIDKDPGDIKRPQDDITPLTDMDIERLIMIRFLGDTVMMLRAGADQMDARTRFGISLYLAGAASSLADQRGLTPDIEKAILAEALKLIGNGNAMSDSFFATYEENMGAAKNKGIVNAGFQSMLQHLQHTNQPNNGFSDILLEWNAPDRTPAPELGDVFLLTYANIIGSTLDGRSDILMNSHNMSVRKIFNDCNGEEIRHTGKGIFARFKHPDDAICAAIAIQQDQEQKRKSPEPLPPVRVAITASLVNQDNPDFSGEIFSHSDSLCRRLGDGRIACDALLQEACTISDVDFGQTIPAVHSGIAEKGRSFEILWNPLPA